MTPENIFETWDESFHSRCAPSLQTIYKIKKQVESGISAEPQKKGPKIKSVLTEEKLDEIRETIDDQPFLTNASLADLVGLPPQTTRNGLKVLGYRRFNAVKTQLLSNAQQDERLSFL